MFIDEAVVWNGVIVPVSKVRPQLNSAWLRNAPGFFDSLRVMNYCICRWTDHWLRMQRTALWWGAELPEELELQKILKQYVAGTDGSGKLRIQWNRTEDGWDWLAVLEPRETAGNWLTNGWNVGVYRDRIHWATDATRYKMNARTTYTMAALWAKDQGFDEALVLNQRGAIADGTTSNLFWWEGKKLCTSSLDSGALEGTVRGRLLRYMAERELSLGVFDPFPGRIGQADELFLTNALRGIVPVASLDGRAYPSTLTRQLFEEFPFDAEQDAFDHVT